MSKEVKNYFKIEITKIIDEESLSPEEPCIIEYIKNGEQVVKFQIGKLGFIRAVNDIEDHTNAVIEVSSHIPNRE